MAGASNPFLGLTLSQLQTLQSAYLTAITALASNQSYSLNGRALTRANLADVTSTLGQINMAIAQFSDDTPNQTVVSFTGQ